MRRLDQWAIFLFTTKKQIEGSESKSFLRALSSVTYGTASTVREARGREKAEKREVTERKAVTLRYLSCHKGREDLNTYIPSSVQVESGKVVADKISALLYSGGLFTRQQ